MDLKHLLYLTLQKAIDIFRIDEWYNIYIEQNNIYLKYDINWWINQNGAFVVKYGKNNPEINPS